MRLSYRRRSWPGTRSTRHTPAGATKQGCSALCSGSSRPTGAICVTSWVEGVAEAPVLGSRITPFGVLYEVTILIDGLIGATAPVAAIWIVEEDRPPRLVSTWVDIP